MSQFNLKEEGCMWLSCGVKLLIMVINEKVMRDWNVWLHYVYCSSIITLTYVFGVCV